MISPIMCPPHQETDSTCGDRPYKAAKYLSSAGLGMLEPSSHGGFHHMPNVDNHHRGPGTRRRCPDCGSPLVKRSSASQHLLMSRTFLVCKNVVCGATFAGTDEITHRLSPLAGLIQRYACRTRRVRSAVAFCRYWACQQRTNSLPPSSTWRASHDLGQQAG